jgi:hypothetical protein
LSDTWIVAILALVAIGGAALSFVAWHRVGRPGRSPEDQGETRLDSDDPDV